MDIILNSRSSHPRPALPFQPIAKVLSSKKRCYPGYRLSLPNSAGNRCKSNLCLCLYMPSPSSRSAAKPAAAWDYLLMVAVQDWSGEQPVPLETGAVHPPNLSGIKRAALILRSAKALFIPGGSKLHPFHQRFR